MNWLDIVIVVLVVIYAMTGFTHGFILNSLGSVGLIGGGLLGVLVVPVIFSPNEVTVRSSVASLLIVLVLAGLGQAAGSAVGMRLRARRQTTQALDSAAGATFGAITVLVAAWAIGFAVSGSSIPHVSEAARNSTVLATVDEVMPRRAADVLADFSRNLTTDVFPRYLEPFNREVIRTTAPPDESTLARAEVQQARSSIMRIRGEAECGKGLEGSGFVYAPGRVMTNAHVVAGVSSPRVELNGRWLEGDIVVFDPQLDIAVLSVPTDAIPLSFDTTVTAGDSAVVLGFPENGPFDARPARVREVLTMRSLDIYGTDRISRETISIRSLIRPGNSGGPLLSPEGRVLGVIFAASQADAETGYAVTAEAVQQRATDGIAADKAVSTGRCL